MILFYMHPSTFRVVIGEFFVVELTEVKHAYLEVSHSRDLANLDCLVPLSMENRRSGVLYGSAMLRNPPHRSSNQEHVPMHTST
jgi:hypothetical protein